MRGHGSHDRGLRATVQSLGIELGTSGRTAGALTTEPSLQPPCLFSKETECGLDGRGVGEDLGGVGEGCRVKSPNSGLGI